VARTFSAWKSWCAARLLEIARSSEDESAKRSAEQLLAKLKYLRLESIPAFLSLLNAAASASGDNRFLELAPRPEEVAEWFKGREEGACVNVREA
jgi:hypothetical protein